MDEEHIESVEKTVEAISKKQRIEEAKYQDLAKDDNLVVVDEISDEEIEGMYNCFDHHAGIVISQADEHSPPPTGLHEVRFSNGERECIFKCNM